jgi:hypothetical protein
MNNQQASLILCVAVKNFSNTGGHMPGVIAWADILNEHSMSQHVDHSQRVGE